MIITNTIDKAKNKRKEEQVNYKLELDRIVKRTIGISNDIKMINSYYKKKAVLDHKVYNLKIREKEKQNKDNDKYYFSKQINVSDKDLEIFKFFHRNKPKKIIFLKTILNMKGLFGVTWKGDEICTTTIAHHLKVSPQTICNYLNELQEKNVILLCDKTFIPGKVSRKWLVVCPKLRLLQLRYVLLTRPLIGRNKEIVNLSIKIIKKLNLMQKRKNAWKEYGQTALGFFVLNQKNLTHVKNPDLLKSINNSQRLAFQNLLKVSKYYINCPWDFLRDLGSSITVKDIYNYDIESLISLARRVWNWMTNSFNTKLRMNTKTFNVFAWGLITQTNFLRGDKSPFYVDAPCPTNLLIRDKHKEFIEQLKNDDKDTAKLINKIRMITRSDNPDNIDKNGSLFRFVPRRGLLKTIKSKVISKGKTAEELWDTFTEFHNEKDNSLDLNDFYKIQKPKDGTMAFKTSWEGIKFKNLIVKNYMRSKKYGTFILRGEYIESNYSAFGDKIPSLS